MNITHRFPIGTKYMSRGKRQDVCTVIDHLTITNSKGEIVAVRYITSHQFFGQIVIESEVLDTTIARGLLVDFAQNIDA